MHSHICCYVMLTPYVLVHVHRPCPVVILSCLILQIRKRNNYESTCKCACGALKSENGKMRQAFKKINK